LPPPSPDLSEKLDTVILWSRNLSSGFPTTFNEKSQTKGRKTGATLFT
jgi:hypothetical protein